MTLAEQNESKCYRVLSACTEVSFENPSLNVFHLYAGTREARDRTLSALLNNRVRHEVTEIFVNNLFGCEITVPRIIIEA